MTGKAQPALAPESITRGTMLTVAMRWTDRSIGLFSTLILARLLTPEDFGLIAMATLVIALTDILLDLGINTALVRERDITQADYDTAWTLRLLQTACSTLVIIVLAPQAALYFQDPRLVAVLQILAFVLLLGGLENIGVVAFHKHMQFAAEFRFLFIRRLAGVLITLIAAWLLASYWALVIGMLGGRVIGVMLSYWLHPMRPRLGLSRFRHLFAVSLWMFVRGIGEFLHNNLHRLLVGRWNSAPVMGAYTVANEISTLPSSELVAPMNRALFPALVNASADPPERERIFLLALGLQSLVALPASVGLALVAPHAVPLVLGDAWLAAVPLLQWLALAGIAHSLSSSTQYLLLVLGHFRWAAAIIWLQVFGFVTLVVGLGAQDADHFAALRLAATALGVIASALCAVKLARIRASALIGATARPMLATLIMALCLTWMDAAWQLSSILTLLTQVGAGAIIYTAAILALWRLQHAPAGPEQWLTDKVLLIKR